jgi:hypothetical protein
MSFLISQFNYKMCDNFKMCDILNLFYKTNFNKIFNVSKIVSKIFNE